MTTTAFQSRDAREFDQFYRAYPRHDARADAWKAWQQTRATRPPLQALLDAVQLAAHANEWTASRRRFIPLPASWLRGERWSDEFDVPTPRAPTRPAPDPQDVERRERERMHTMRARAAWSDVVQAMKHRSMPLGGWSEAGTAGALDAIGGFSKLCRCTSSAELHQQGLAFERAWLDAALDADGNKNKAGMRLQLVRRA